MIKFIIHNSFKPFPLDKKSVQTVVTSPPYLDQRSYAGLDNQIGDESSVEDYVENMRIVSRNVWEVLNDEGSYFLNIGDKYINKKLQLVPYRVAMALMEDGWVLRNVISWNKIAPLPYPGKDRLRNSYEPMFHFVKQAKYYYDLDAIRMPHQTISAYKIDDEETAKKKLGKEVSIDKPIGLFGDIEEVESTGYKTSKLYGQDRKNIGARGGFAQYGESVKTRYADGGRNPGDVFLDDAEITFNLECKCGLETIVPMSAFSICPSTSDSWFITPEQWKGCHTATFPTKLVERCIRVSSKPGDLVLDPFCGSGTTCVTAEKLNRDSVGFDIAYSEDRDKRVGLGIQQSLLEIK